MNLVEFDDDVANDVAALFKTVEAFRGTFLFSSSVELKTKRGEGAGGEITDSNTSLPSIFPPQAFFSSFSYLLQ